MAWINTELRADEWKDVEYMTTTTDTFRMGSRNRGGRGGGVSMQYHRQQWITRYFNPPYCWSGIINPPACQVKITRRRMNDASLGEDGQHCFRMNISLGYIPIKSDVKSRCALNNWVGV